MKKINTCIISTIIILSGCTNNTAKESKTGAIEKEIYNSAFIGNNSIMISDLDSGFPIDKENDKGKSLLIKAIESNNLESVKTLLTKGALINEPNKTDGSPPLFYCESEEMLQLLLENKADINATDNLKVSVLRYYLENKPRSYSEILLSKGAKIHLKDGDRSINDAFTYVRTQDPQMIKLMLASDQMAFAERDHHGNYPISYAKDEGTLLELLNITNYDMSATNIYKENVMGELYLKAVANGWAKAVDKLINKGVDPKYRSYGNDATTIANAHGQVLMERHLKNIIKK